MNNKTIALVIRAFFVGLRQPSQLFPDDKDLVKLAQDPVYVVSFSSDQIDHMRCVEGKNRTRYNSKFLTKLSRQLIKSGLSLTIGYDPLSPANARRFDIIVIDSYSLRTGETLCKYNFGSSVRGGTTLVTDVNDQVDHFLRTWIDRYLGGNKKTRKTMTKELHQMLLGPGESDQIDEKKERKSKKEKKAKDEQPKIGKKEKKRVKKEQKKAKRQAESATPMLASNV